jgi:hypothetical protein
MRAFNIDRVNVTVESYRGAVNRPGATGVVRGTERRAAYTVCSLQGRIVARGTLDTGAHATSSALRGRSNCRGVYLLRVADGRPAAVRTCFVR